MKRPNDTSIRRREFLKAGSAAAMGLGCIGRDSNAEVGMDHHRSMADRPAVHNMLIVGQQTAFLSHLPMFRAPDFDSPHRYQGILEAAFSKPGSDAQAVYAKDRKDHPGTKIYTLSPATSFVLPDLNSQTASPPISPFKATIFRGHLEKGGRRILEKVDVTIKRIIHFREFNPDASPPPSLEYVLFGKGNETFLAHFISKPPDFDQVISVRIPDHPFTDSEMAGGLSVSFDKPNTIDNRLKERAQEEGRVSARNPSQPLKLEFRTDRELYFEEGELRVPAEFETTPAERTAKFP